MRIDFVIAVDPAAAGAHAQVGGARFPLLEKILARGEAWPLSGIHGLSACIGMLFGLSDARLPIAALGLLGEGIEPGAHHWLRLDPIHLRPERSELRLLALPEDSVAPAEAAALVAALAPHFAQDGASLLAPRPQQWYLQSNRRLDPATCCPRRTAGLLHEQTLPGGPDGAYWRRLITEAQMLLHDQPLNELREAAGKLAINGVWPWGGGNVQPVEPTEYVRVYADEAWIRGLARASGALPLPVPTAATEPVEASADMLLVLKTSAARSLPSIEQHWLPPLVRALEREAASELRLVLLTEGEPIGRRVLRRHLRRWWRPRVPLALHA
jgi:hypothetical protein